MKRYVMSSDEYPSLRGEFSGKIRYHSESTNDSGVQIKLSYKTAFLYINGENVCSFYPSKGDTLEFWVRELKESCQDYGHPISDAKAEELAAYMLENIRG